MQMPTRLKSWRGNGKERPPLRRTADHKRDLTKLKCGDSLPRDKTGATDALEEKYSQSHSVRAELRTNQSRSLLPSSPPEGRGKTDGLEAGSRKREPEPRRPPAALPPPRYRILSLLSACFLSASPPRKPPPNPKDNTSPDRAAQEFETHRLFFLFLLNPLSLSGPQFSHL